MPDYTRIPEAEFEIMQIIWSQPPPISSMQVTGLQEKWKHQTVRTLLTRLEKRGYVSSEKQGKERAYTPAVPKDEYLSMELGYFLQKFRLNNLTGLMSAMYPDSDPSDEELLQFEQWIKTQRDGGAQ